MKAGANMTLHNHRYENLKSYITQTSFSGNTGKFVLQENRQVIRQLKKTKKNLMRIR
jgi:hypothetical protein